MDLPQMTTAKLVDVNKKKHFRLEMRILESIADMLDDREPITIATVVRRAGTTKQVIYRNENLRRIILYYTHVVQNQSYNEYEDPSERYRFLMDIPDLVRMEEYVNKLIEENKELGAKLLRVESEIIKYKNRRLCDISDDSIYI
ncbi:MAG: hypothetical protein IJH71_08115 [Eubacterium sp.]|nr:hypothetical protein [Eubacterium sp.]